MKSINIEIHEDEKFEFFQKYDTLSPLRKKIWQKTVWAVRTMLDPHPSQTKIANWCKCSRSAVSEAFGIFKKWGWLALLSRGFKKSKTLLIPIAQTMIDVHKREWFRRIEATHKATHTYSNRYRNTSRASEIKKEGLRMSELATKLQFSLEGGLKLALLPEHIQQETLRKCKNLGKTGFRPDNQERYFLGIAFNLAEEQGFKPDWKRFYSTWK